MLPRRGGAGGGLSPLAAVMERNTAITIETLPRFSAGSLRLTLPRIRMWTFLQIVGRILHAGPEPAGERGLHLIDI